MKKIITVGIASLALLAGCATTPPVATPPAEPAQPLTDTTPVASPTPEAPSATPSVAATPSENPTPIPSAKESTSATPKPKATPSASATPSEKPLRPLTETQQAEFGKCVTTKVTSGSKGACTTLLLSNLKKLGFYTGKSTSSMGVAGMNAVLRYQRSRGIPATGTFGSQSWNALASNAPAVPEVLPAACKTAGVVLCVDQSHEKLKYVKDGKVVKTIKVRLGGWADHPKTGIWRVFPTANGTFRVYDKQVNPASDNYGSGAMPYSVMFDPNMYVHYSSGFKNVGYARSSHGCVNVGSLTDAKWFFKNTPVGAKVVVFTADSFGRDYLAEAEQRKKEREAKASASPSAAPTGTPTR